MKELLKTTAAISATEVTLVVVALMRNKYLAVAIGPEGFGIYGLLISFFNLAAVFSGTWLATGTTKYISEYNKNNDSLAVQKICGLSLGLTSVISSVMAILFIIGQEPIRKIFLSDDVLAVYFSLFAISFIGMSLRPLVISILQGLMQVKAVVTARIIISLVEICLVVSLVYLFELTGFFVSILVSTVFGAGLLLKKLKGCVGKIAFPKFEFDSVSKKLLSFGAVNFFLAITNLGAQYFQRKLVLDQMGLASVGLLHAAIAIKNYSDIVGRGSGFYFYPKMSERLGSEARRRKINDYMFFSLVIYIPIMIIIILFREFIISILYSDKFLQLIPVLPWFIVAEYLHNLQRPFAQTVVGLAALKIHALSCILTSLCWVLIPLFFITKYGLKSIAFAYALGTLCYMTLSIIYLKKRISLIVNQRNIILGVLGFTAIIFISIIPINILIRPFIILAVLMSLFLLINKEEKMKIYSIAVKFRKNHICTGKHKV